MARPRGEIRLALQLAAADAPGSTARELAAKAQVGFRAAQRAIENMTRAGDLIDIGRKPVPWRRSPVRVYAPSEGGAAPSARAIGTEIQQMLMTAWR